MITFLSEKILLLLLLLLIWWVSCFIAGLFQIRKSARTRPIPECMHLVTLIVVFSSPESSSKFFSLICQLQIFTLNFQPMYYCY